jgi:anti-sigma factor RsiW
MSQDENCRRLLDSLSGYVDGELSDELCVEINRHLSACENCRIVVDTLKKTIYLYHVASASPEIPSEVRERLYQCLDLQNFMTKQQKT